MEATKASHYWRARIKARAIALLGGCCVKCGLDDLRLLTINHKNGDGSDERRRTGSANPYGCAIYGKIVKGTRPTEDLDVRCYNCNILYEYETARRVWPPEIPMAAVKEVAA